MSSRPLEQTGGVQTREKPLAKAEINEVLNMTRCRQGGDQPQTLEKTDEEIKTCINCKSCMQGSIELREF